MTFAGQFKGMVHYSTKFASYLVVFYADSHGVGLLSQRCDGGAMWQHKKDYKA